jgi:hypothetical protein
MSNEKQIKQIGRDLCPPILWKLASRFRPSRFRREPEKKPIVEPLVWDETRDWMGFVVPGMLQRGNIDLFSYCFKRLPSEAPIIEIGSFAGRSLNYMILFLRRAGRTNLVFSVDEWKFENVEPSGLIDGRVPFEKYRAHVIETFRRNTTLFSGDRLPHHIELSSDAFFSAWASGEQRSDFFDRPIRLGGPISFAYIDGNHTYAQSKKDFDNVDNYLEPGGFIVFDDSEDWSIFECKRTAEEAADLTRYEVVAKNPNYCLRKRS